MCLQEVWYLNDLFVNCRGWKLSGWSSEGVHNNLEGVLNCFVFRVCGGFKVCVLQVSRWFLKLALKGLG